MKRLVFFAFLVLYLFTGCNRSKDKVIITGNIIDQNPSEFEYTVPINGIDYFGFKENVNPDSLGNFSISLDADRPAFIEFLKGFKCYGTVIIEPGMNYEISINTGLKEGAFKTISKNEAGQELYNRLTNRSMVAGGHFELEAHKFMSNTDPDSIKQALIGIRENETKGFGDLLEDEIISQDFFDLVISDRGYFYAGASGSVAFVNFMSAPVGHNSLTKEQYEKLWEEVFREAPVSDPKLLSSPWSFYYNQNYLRFKEFIADSVDDSAFARRFEEGTIHTHNIETAKKYLANPSLEYYYAAYVYYEAINRNYEKELISLLAQFEQEYPESKYTKYLTPLINEVVEFHKQAEQAFTEKYKFPENYQNYNSLEECLKAFYGRKVYIDTWATWCGPCKTEFEHNKELTGLLKLKNVEILYISIDEDDKEQQWKNMIRFYDLEGHHVRANREFLTDLRRIYGKNGMLVIPWHMLVDEKGRIIVKHAKASSGLTELEEQIDRIQPVL